MYEEIAKTVVEAFVKGAGGAVAAGLLQRLLKTRDESVSDESSKVAKLTYDSLERVLTGGCVRALVVLSSQYNLAAEQVFDELYPALKQSADHSQLVHEFEYRLRFLSLLGVVNTVSSEFAITNLGLSFLREAQNKLKWEREIPRRLRV
jgi:hypothetical protein